MTIQKDVLAGLDVSSLDNISQEQMMQMVNGIAPLANIGFIIVGTQRPDITNNSRFIRYFWMDISDPSNPNLKRYIGDRIVLQDADASWASIGVDSSAILTSMIAQRSSSGGVDITRMKLNADYSASAANAFWILRVAANGKDIEVVSLSTAFADSGGIDFDAITLAGSGPNKYLGINASILEYKYITPATDFTAAFGNQIPLETAVFPSTARFIPRTNAAGTAVEWVTPNSIFDALELLLSKLAQSGATANDMIRWDGANWSKVTPTLRIVNADTANSGILSTAGGTGDLTNAVHTIAHLLVGVPKLVRVRAKCLNAELGYTAGDEIDIAGVRNTGSNPNVGTVVDGTNIVVLFDTATMQIQNKGTGVFAGADETKWQVKVYAWL